LNHLPLTGLFAALLGLAAGLVLRKRELLFLGLAFTSLFALSAWPVSEYGEQGYDRVLAMSDDDGRACLQRHRELADRWVFLYYVTSGAGAVAMVAGWKWPKSLWIASLVVALVGAGSLSAGAVIAKWGGMVRHREFRPDTLSLTQTVMEGRGSSRPGTVLILVSPSAAQPEPPGRIHDSGLLVSRNINFPLAEF
jgi:hypothetical protein